jgi:hypothetical protein
MWRKLLSWLGNMHSTAIPHAARIGGMAKRKSDSGRHVKKRVNIGVPAEWHAVIRRLAADRQQPVLYWLISVVAEQAKQQGMTDVPVPPWEAEPPT